MKRHVREGGGEFRNIFSPTFFSCCLYSVCAQRCDTLFVCILLQKSYIVFGKDTPEGLYRIGQGHG